MEKRGLVGEVVREDSVGATGFARDVASRRAANAVAGDHPPDGVDDLLSPSGVIDDFRHVALLSDTCPVKVKELPKIPIDTPEGRTRMRVDDRATWCYKKNAK